MAKRGGLVVNLRLDGNTAGMLYKALGLSLNRQPVEHEVKKAITYMIRRHSQAIIRGAQSEVLTQTTDTDTDNQLEQPSGGVRGDVVADAQELHTDEAAGEGSSGQGG
jgi:hypothetical protein